jgi:hypothetical protein
MECCVHCLHLLFVLQSPGVWRSTTCDAPRGRAQHQHHPWSEDEDDDAAAPAPKKEAGPGLRLATRAAGRALGSCSYSYITLQHTVWFVVVVHGFSLWFSAAKGSGAFSTYLMRLRCVGGWGGGGVSRALPSFSHESPSGATPTRETRHAHPSARCAHVSRPARPATTSKSITVNFARHTAQQFPWCVVRARTPAHALFARLPRGDGLCQRLQLHL